MPENSIVEVQNSPTFFVGDLPIYGTLILAPMDGITDFPFRQLTRKLGSALSYCEFVNPVDIFYGPPNLERKLSFSEAERPVVIQLYDEDIERIIKAAILLEERKPDIIDINMGCPAKRVSRRGAGAGLLKSPKKIAEIFKRLSAILHTPLSGKIRLGWDENQRNYLEVAKIIEDNGGKSLTVHGRTKSQGYTGIADWDAIAEIKQNLSIPIIGNGDVKTVTDIDQMIFHTKCDGVMIGREAVKNPWIFSKLDRDKVPPGLEYNTIIEHLKEMISFYGDERGVIIFRKFLKGYLCPYPLEVEAMKELMTTSNEDKVIDLVSKIFSILSETRE